MSLLYTGTTRSQVIDSEGYRANVGIIVSNGEGRVLWCRRLGQDAWQFPQGGIENDETPEQALYRELREETGLCSKQVTILGRTRDWFRYQIPSHLIRRDDNRPCIGQKQIWFLLELLSNETNLNAIWPKHAEFEEYSWVDYWYPVEHVVFFKKNVYRKALTALEPLLSQKRPGWGGSRRTGKISGR